MSAAAHVRRLNEPVVVDVRLGADGRPSRVAWRSRRGGRGHDRRRYELVEVVLDTWCVDDAWWSEQPVRRIYHELQLVGGARLVVSWDLVEQRWLAQR
jgi:hypothetical protein